MAKLNARRKGANGEREFCRWIAKLLDLDKIPERNLEQVRHGGADVLGIGNFVFEVKRCEKLQLRKWWIQVKNAMIDPNTIPVVVFRKNNDRWAILISATHIGLKYGFIQLPPSETEQWLKRKYKEWLGPKMKNEKIIPVDFKRVVL